MVSHGPDGNAANVQTCIFVSTVRIHTFSCSNQSKESFNIYRIEPDRMTSDLNVTLLHQCQAASNLTVVCSDGVIFSHKLIAASASDFIKLLLSDVPPYDEVTLYLPDFTKCEVELFFESVFSSGTHTEHDIFRDSEEADPIVCIQIKMEEGLSPKYEEEDISLADNDREGDDIEEDFVKDLLEPSLGYSLKERVRLIQNLKLNPIYEAEAEEDERENEEVEKRIKYVTESPTEDLKEEEQMTTDHVPHPTAKNERSDITEAEGPKVEERSITAARGKFSIEELKEEEEHLTRDLIPNPTTEKEKRNNKKLEKKIKFGKAMMEVLNGSHMRPAARKFGVSESTLRWSCKHGKKYYGGGNHSKVLTSQEERDITKRMLATSNGGEDLTHGSMRQILRKELEVIKVNEPHREEIFRVCPEDGDVKYDYLYNFASRNDLLKFTSPGERKKRRIHKCDLCEKSYVLKNALMYHRKQVHLL